MVQLYAIVPIGHIDAPIDPGYGRPGGGGRPGHDLPGGMPDSPWGPPGMNRPDQGLPGGGWSGRPDHELPGGRPDHPWAPGHRPDRPDHGLPGGGHPDQGLPGGGHASQLPAFVRLKPDNTLPEIPGAPPPTHKPTPPGTIWPPLPPGLPEGKVAILVWISGVGHRYAVIDTSDPANKPDQSLPPEGGTPPTTPAPTPIA
jgi:hypothetical protein